MKCPRCGEKIKEGSTICSWCGYDLKGEFESIENTRPAGVAVDEDLTSEQRPVYDEGEKSDKFRKNRGGVSKDRTLFALGATGLISILVVIIILLASIAFPAAMKPIYFEGLTDTDGDGYNDDVDEFPDNSQEHKDSDGDGVGDNEDAFPHDEDYSEDSDRDGVSDVDDEFPYDEDEWIDSDGDGVGDNEDEFPDDSGEWKDTDGDGYGDNEDELPFDPTEFSDRDSDGVGDKSDDLPDDPSEWRDTDGDGYGDVEDVFPFDRHEWYDSDGDGYGNNVDSMPKDDDRWDYHNTYEFYFDGKGYAIDTVISCEYYHYDGYWEGDWNYHHASDLNNFIEPDGVLARISLRLDELAEHEGYTGEQKANFILRFVQSMEYLEDPDDGDIAKYPADTLIDEGGDCEDTSVLYAAIMEWLGYEAAFILLESGPGESNHVMVGVNLEGINGTSLEYSGTRYYTAETTGVGYEIGYMSEDFGDYKATVIPVYL